MAWNETGRGGSQATVEPVQHRGPASVRLDDGRTLAATAALVGGRDRRSVGGVYADGPRWWRGDLAWQDAAPTLDPGEAIELQLSNGRTAMATVSRSTDSGAVHVTGVGAPPFDVS